MEERRVPVSFPSIGRGMQASSQSPLERTAWEEHPGREPVLREGRGTEHLERSSLVIE